MPATKNAIASCIHKQAMKLMGNRFEITVVSPDAEWANDRIAAAVAEIKRIEQLLTTYDENSETNQVNRAAGISPVKVSEETFQLIKRSIRISDITQGAFDITYGSIDKRLWNFDQTMTRLPDAKTAKKMVRLINYRNILLDEKEHTVYLKEKGMRIGFGGIGKGYAAEKAKQLLKESGVESGIVNASGDLAAWGVQPDGKPWTVGIVNPNFANKIFSVLEVTDMAVATSGNYEKFTMINGVKYSHTINPRTGLPVQGIKSVTIITPNAEIADAMATPVTIMGIRTGLDMINQLKNIEAIIIDDNDKIYTSGNLHFA
ncbi:FAD:protein FMN transferase [Flavihumibacter profundi]|jgi:FAD:protein FMN transferase|uniref:FAD:protein FMN transferase n=1 Tax=Flavihumibacter profundi TaxID=2716883 RepID=UPI001CC45193|nr:FAD:protein FMN transferase [Flavihumibacter profundi]MBZ5858713.1 FAD:protein FMN transferase [Flavihumibacter profundi]